MFFEPSPVLMAFLLYKAYLFLLALLPLALLRLLAAQGPARWAALLSLALALLGLAAQFWPVLAGSAAPPLPLVTLRNAWGGMAMPLLASLPLLASGLLRGWRWRWIDLLHGVLLLPLVLGGVLV